MGWIIGKGIGVPFRMGGSQNWSSYWTRQSEVLFFGLYSEISGGQMPNKVDGGATYLTVAGSAGSETYQCPNTAPYRIADTDYIWFKTDVSQRTTTTAELIGYDFTRTIVKYANTAPYAIESIMILNSDVDTAKMRDDFDLSVWWSGVLSLSGNLKGNRLLSKSEWNPYEIELGTYINGLITPLSTGQKVLLNNLILNIKSGLSITNLSDTFDQLYILAGETQESSLRNLAKNAHHITSASIPTFVALEGFYGGGTTYLDTNYNASAGTKVTGTSAGFGMYVRNVVSASSVKTHGTFDTGSGAAMRIYPERSAGFARMHLGSGTDITVAVSNSVGIIHGYRSGNQCSGSKNKVHGALEANNFSAFPNINTYLCSQRNTDATTSNYNEHHLSVYWSCSYLTDAEKDIVVDAIEAYMDSNGKGVL